MTGPRATTVNTGLTVAAEKSLTEKKLTNKQTNKHNYRNGKNYIPPRYIRTGGIKIPHFMASIAYVDYYYTISNGFANATSFIHNVTFHLLTREYIQLASAWFYAAGSCWR